MTMEAKNTREYRLYHNITTPEQEMQRLEAIVRNLKQERDEAKHSPQVHFHSANRGSYAQKTKELLEATRGLSSTNTEGTWKIECLRSHLETVTNEMERYYAALTPAQRENLPKPEGVGER